MSTIFRWLMGLTILAALRRLITMVISGTLAEAELIPMREAVVEVDIGGVGTWVAIESWSLMVEPSRGTTPVSEEKTLDGLNHTGRGTRGNATVKVTLFATNDSSAPLENMYDQIDELCDVRWSKAGLPGENRFYTDGGFLSECNPPGFDANGNMSAKWTFTITGPDILRELIPT